MAKCPKCGSEMQPNGDLFKCPSCGRNLKVENRSVEQEYATNSGQTESSAMSDEEKIRALEQRLATLEAEKREREKSEQSQLEQRLAKLEAEKEERERRADKLKNIGNSKAVTFLKKNWLFLCVGLMLFVAFLTLMITFVGLRGIYVNVNDSNDFYDFGVSTYRASSIDFFTGNETLEEGKWKIKDGKLILTTEDEMFGEISGDFDFEHSNGYKSIKIDEDEYKRVSLVGLKTLQKKVKITFDPQNGDAPTVYKIKMGDTFQNDPPEDIENDDLQFLGWFTEKDGKGTNFNISGSHVWENKTYYAFWPTFVLNNGVLTKVDKNKMLGSITIPNTVTSIGKGAFSGCTGLTEITIPNSVTSIGYEAFSGCTSLTEITIPDRVTSIGEDAFYGCTNLQTVNWNATNCTTVGNSSNSIFNGCTQLDTVNIGKNVQTIPDYAFSDCIDLTAITIPDSVKSIGYEAFSGCTGLQTVIIGKGITGISDSAFYGCTGLDSLKVAIDNKIYKSDGNCIIEKSSGTLILGCKNSIIPSYVTSIGNYAFDDCTGLKEIIIPYSVTNIAWYAFYRCTNLQTVYYEGTSKHWDYYITIGGFNDNFKKAKRYYFSEDDPYEKGTAVEGEEYWHWNANHTAPEVWVKKS